MKALYRKYRPTKLSDVIGEEQVVKPLEASLKSGKISHAYLFTGPRGCGKTSVARIFAHEVNNFKYEIEDDYVDIIEIDAASNTGVDNIRDLREKAAIAPTKGKYKVYIIDEVHMLSKSAFNALLKTLEEPPESVIFIMATTDAYKVPVTITSRTQNYTFTLASPEIMLKHLESIAKQEKINIEKSALELIVAKGGGSFRDTISLLDQISTLKSDKITKKDVINALGLPGDDIAKNLLTAYKSGDLNTINSELKNILNSGIKPETLAEDLISFILKNPEPKMLPLLEELPKVSSPFPEAKLLLAFVKNAAEQPIFHKTQPREGITTDINTGADAIIAPTEGSDPITKAQAPETTSIKQVQASETAPAKQAKTTETASQRLEPLQNLDWPNYISKVKSTSAVVGSTLEKCTHELRGSELYLFTERRIHKTILSSENNHRVLTKFLPEGITVTIEDGSEIVKKDQNLSKISDIMGDIEEVNTNGVPF